MVGIFAAYGTAFPKTAIQLVSKSEWNLKKIFLIIMRNDNNELSSIAKGILKI